MRPAAEDAERATDVEVEKDADEDEADDGTVTAIDPVDNDVCDFVGTLSLVSVFAFFGALFGFLLLDLEFFFLAAMFMNATFGIWR